MYCYNCKNYYGDGHCRVNGYTSHLKKADALPCFEPEEKTNQNTNDMKEFRKCRICGYEHPLEEFAKDSRSKDGISHICNDCAEQNRHNRVRKLKATLKKRQAKACAELGITLPGGNEKTPAKKGGEENHIALTKEPKTPEPKPEEKAKAQKRDEVDKMKGIADLLYEHGYKGTLTKMYNTCEITITIR